MSWHYGCYNLHGQTICFKKTGRTVQDLETIPLSYKFVNTTIDTKIVAMFRKTLDELGLNFQLGLEAAIQEWSIRQK